MADSLTMIEFDKYYFDCVTPEAQAFIGYAASLRLFGGHIPWSALQFWLEQRHIRRGLFRRHRVQETDTATTLSIPGYGMTGYWRGESIRPALALIDNPDITISWRLLQIGNPADVRIPKHRLTGVGYAEHLRVALRQPRLPFAELRWGRFIAHDGSRHLIWIAWNKGLRKTWVINHGNNISHNAEIREEAVECAWGKLELQAVRTLADTHIGTYLPKWLVFALGGKLAGGNEQKYLAKGYWQGKDGHTAEGWVLHEIVMWS